MFRNEGGRGDAGTSYLPLALVFSLVVRKDKRAGVCKGLWGFDP